MTPPRLTPAQQAAVLYFEGDSVLLAGAGSGKTTVLVEKAAALIEKLHVPPDRILIVTFTEKAAGEMKERLGRRLKLSRDRLDLLPIGTIHGAAASLVRRFGTPLGIDPSFTIMNDFLAGLERRRAVRDTFLSLVEARHSEALEAVGHLGLGGSLRFFSRVLERPADGKTPYAGALDAIRSSYRERKRALGMLDFDDLENSLLALLKADGADLSSLFSWIIVDEFQDTSPLQWEILSRLCGSNRMVLVGDPRQSIYRFRRSEPKLFSDVARDIQERGGRLFHLNENFRSAPEVVEFVNLVAGTLFAQGFPPLVATRKDLEGGIDRLSIPQQGPVREIRGAEARSVLDHLSRLRDQGILWNSMALLFRTRHAVGFYESVLKERKIPYRTTVGSSLLERPEILAAAYFLKKLSGPEESARAFIEEVLSHSPLAGLEMSPPSSLTALLEEVFERIGPLLSASAPEVSRNLKAFKALLLDLVRLEISDLKILLENVESLRNEEARVPCPNAEDPREDALTLMTVHGAKGLEFPVVVLCDLAAKRAGSARARGAFVESASGDVVLKDKDPDAAGLKDGWVKGEAYADLEGKEKDEEFEESKRLLYVALTRAQHRIVLPLPARNLDRRLEKKGRKDETLEAWSDWLQPVRIGKAR